MSSMPPNQHILLSPLLNLSIPLFKKCLAGQVINLYFDKTLCIAGVPTVSIFADIIGIPVHFFLLHRNL